MNGGNDQLEQMIEESGLRAHEYAGVAEALLTLRDVVPERVPAPSPELAALLSGAAVSRVPRARPGKRRSAMGAGAIAAAVVLGTGWAAAANTLPEPAQRFVSDLSEKYLPFHFPAPDERGDEGSEPPAGVDGGDGNKPAPTGKDAKADRHGELAGNARDSGRGSGGHPGKESGAPKVSYPGDPDAHGAGGSAAGRPGGAGEGEGHDNGLHLGADQGTPIKGPVKGTVKGTGKGTGLAKDHSTTNPGNGRPTTHPGRANGGAKPPKTDPSERPADENNDGRDKPKPSKEG